MSRNLNRRVEASSVSTTPAPSSVHEILDVVLNDDRLAWTLAGDGVWTKQRGPAASTPMRDCSSWPRSCEWVRPPRRCSRGIPRSRCGQRAAVWRTVDGHVELLLVRRESHKDWTMPKGKLDEGETLRACALARSRRRPVSAVSPVIGCRSSPTPTAKVDRRRWSTGR